MHCHTFSNPVGILYCYKSVDYAKEMLVYELSDDMNHIQMHWEFGEIIVRKNKKK